MNILIINWRSIKDPLKGGADLATFEIAERLVENYRANVSWIAPKYDKSVSQEKINGIDFIYLANPFQGRRLNLFCQFLKFYISVPLYYFSHFKGKIDVVIDQIHGLPYVTPLYVKEKVVAYIHEVAGPIWDYEFPFPINIVGKTLEKTILKLFYKKTVFITVSPSTKRDLTDLGLPEKNINIVFNGVSFPPNENAQKDKDFIVVFLNRLVKMKGIERGLKAFSILKESLPTAKMWIIGTGKSAYQEKLKKICYDLNIADAVSFFGRPHDQEKYDLLSKAHVLINPSYKEGWGLVNIEANRCQTPVVAFNVKGNRDSVKQGVSGFLVKDNDLAAMAEAILKVKAQGPKLRQSALEYSRQFDWDKSAKEFYKILLS